MIEGAIIQKLKQIVDDRGKVMHMLRCDSPFFSRFGEIYFSVVNPGVVKAWKKHQKMIQNLTVPIGKIRIVMYDDRKDSPTYGKIEVVEIGEVNYCLVKIPSQVCYGFKGLSSGPSLIANCTDLPHYPDEVINIDAFDKKIPYDWNKG